MAGFDPNAPDVDLRDATCVDDCDHCTSPNAMEDRRFLGIGVGYCKLNDLWVTCEDGPLSVGCEDFREVSC